MDHAKPSVVCYRTLFDAFGIHHSNSGLRIRRDIYIKGFFILLFELTSDRGAWEGHTSHPKNGNNRIDLKFNMRLPAASTCLLYLEFENSVLVVFANTVTTSF